MDSQSRLRNADRVGAPNVQNRLRRFRVEMVLSYGVFFCMGQLTGWMLFARLLFRIIPRAFSHRPGQRVDWAMDLMVKLTYRVGRQAQRLAFLTGAASFEAG